MIGEFPSEAEFKKFENVMGNRRRLSSEDSEFYSFLKKSKAWDKFYNSINSEDFVKNALSQFKDELRVYDSAINHQNFKFDREFLKNKAFKKNEVINKANKTSVGLISSKDLLKIILYRIINKIIERVMRYKVNKKETKLYVHFDISAAHNGYLREIHHDNDDRVIAMVFYLSDHITDSRIGGEFCIHKYKHERDLSMCEAHPNAEDMLEVKRIQPSKNQGIMFLSTPNSYHSVPLIEQADHWRKFIYIGVTVDNPKAWNNSKNSYNS